MNRNAVSRTPATEPTVAIKNTRPAPASPLDARRVAEPRQMAMFLCRELTDSSLPEIGREFGGKHHTTVLHSIRKIAGLRKSDPKHNNIIN